MKKIFTLLLIVNIHLIAGCFSDVPNDKDEICIAKNLGWIEGKNDGEKFEPDEPLNRAESAKILFYFYGKVEEKNGYTFPDVPIDSWFSPFVFSLKSTPIINGRNDGNFYPADKVTFAEASKMALTSLGYVKKNIIPWYKPYTNVIVTLDRGYFSSFSHDKAITRREFIHMLMILNFAKENPFFLTKKIMKKTKPTNDIGKALNEFSCSTTSTLSKRVKNRKICTQRFEKQELAMVYNNENEIDFVVPYVPIFEERTCQVIPSIGNGNYKSNHLFAIDTCGGLCGSGGKGCHILAVGMIDYFYRNKPLKGTDVNDYNQWLFKNKQNGNGNKKCFLNLRKDKRFMSFSANGDQKIYKKFDISNQNYIEEMEKKLNQNSKLQEYIKTRRPVLLQYNYILSTDTKTHLHAIVIVGKDKNGNYIVQDPYFNLKQGGPFDGRRLMFPTLEEVMKCQNKNREKTISIEFKKLVFYHRKG